MSDFQQVAHGLSGSIEAELQRPCVCVARYQSWRFLLPWWDAVKAPAPSHP